MPEIKPGNRFEPHRFQWEILDSKARFTLASSGIQAGKTTIGAVWTIKLLEKAKFTGTFLIASPTYKILNQSTLPKFFEMCGGVTKIGKYRKSDQVIDLYGGEGRIYIRSTEDPNLLEGMTITEGIWLDEAGQMPEAVFTNVVGRGAIKQAPILMTTTPYKINWVFREIIKRAQKGDPNYKVVQWTSRDNPAFPQAEWDERKASMSEGDFARRYGGEWRQLAGLVYPDYDYDKCVIDPIEYRPDWTYICGIDWGFTNPTAVLWIGIDYDGTYYVMDEYLKSGSTSTEICDYIKAVNPRYPVPPKAYYCDPAGRDEIATFVLNGLRNTYGVKTEVMDGIRKVTALIKNNRLKIFSTCRNLIEEIEGYHLPNPTDNRDAREEPVKRQDHAVDALRYAIVNTLAISPTFKPITESELKALRKTPAQVREEFKRLKAIGAKPKEKFRPKHR